MSDHQTPSDEHYELFKAKVKINRLQSALDAALADNAAMLELAKHGCYGETQWDAYSMPVMFQCRCCNSRGKDWRLIDHAESCVMVHPHPGAALLAERDRLRKALENLHDYLHVRSQLSHIDWPADEDGITPAVGYEVAEDIASAALAKDQSND